MDYDGLIIRPPSEADSLILQVAVGCPHNRCTFCPAYKQKHYRVKDFAAIRDEIAAGAGIAPDTRRVFLCDGDPMALPHELLLAVCRELCERFPRLQRIGLYARAASLVRQSDDRLRALRDRRVGIVYMGLESGDPGVLERIGKGSSPDEMVAAATAVRRCGMKLNVSVLLGIGGREHSRSHAVATATLLGRMQPDQVGALTVMIVPGTPLHDLLEQGAFVLPDKFELVRELRDMIAGADLERCLFFSNHASNYLPLRVRMPRDRERTLAMLDAVLAARDERMLRCEGLRAL